MLRKSLSFFLVLISIILICSPSLAALEKQVAAPKITNIKNIEVIIPEGSTYKLPATVIATLSDKNTAKVSVKWDKNVPTTIKAGIYVFKGTVKGYAPKVTLTLKVTPTIASIQDINTSILCNSNYALPTSIPAKFSDNSTGTITVNWNPANIDYRKVGKYTFEGTVPGYKKTVKLYLTVTSIYKSVENIKATFNPKQSYALPKTVKATLFDDKIVDAPVTWDQSSVNKVKTERDMIEGVVEGYPGKVLIYFADIPTIVDIPNKSLTLVKGDIYTLPDTIDAIMSDGSTIKVKVSWTPSKLDLNKLGVTEVIGKVEAYDKEVKWTINILTDFTLMSRGANYTQWGYIPIVFSKNLVACTNLDNFILKDQDGIQVRIRSAVPGITFKDNLCITPAHDLDRTKTYTLTILKNTIQSESGELFPEEISFVVNMKL